MTHISYNPWNPYKPTTCSTNFDLKPIPLDCRSTGRSPPAPLASRAPGAWFVLAIFDAFGYYCEDFVFVLKVLQPRLHMLGLLLPLRHELSPRCGSSLPRPANWDAEAQEASSSLYCSFQQWHTMLFHQTRKCWLVPSSPATNLREWPGTAMGLFAREPF